MKLVRALIIALVVLLVLGTVAVGVALTPSVQRWAVMRAMRGQPGLKFEATAIAAGLSHLRVAGVRAEKGRLAIQLEQFDADYSPWQLLFSRRLVLGKVQGRGLVVDASKLSPDKTGAAAAGAPAAAPGLLTNIELPFALVLDDCVIEGRALLPGPAGGPPVEAEYKITGGKFAPGQEGELVLTATVKNPAAKARVTTLRSAVTLRGRQTDHRTFDRVGITALVDAEGTALSGQEQLKLAAELTRSSAAENYTFTVDTLIGGQTGNVLTVSAALPAGGVEFAGDWKLLAETAQLESFFLGAALPDFNARGEGHFTFNATAVTGSLQGGLDAEVRRLEAIEPSWRAIGPVKVAAKFDLAYADDVARLNQLNLTVSGEKPVLELSAARAAEIQIQVKKRRLLIGGAASGEALNLTLHGLPLAWIRPFVKGMDVSGGLVTGQVAISGESDRQVLRALQPLRIQGLNIVQQGVPLLTRADLAMRFEAVLTEDDLQAVVDEFSLKTPAGDSLTAQAKVTVPVLEDPPVTVAATYNADLPTLLAPWLPLGRVKAAGESDFTMAGRELEVRRFQVGVTDAAGLDLFKASALRPFMFDLSTQQARVPGASGAVDLLRVALGRVPLAALPISVSQAKLGGFVAQGEFVVAMDGDRIAVRSPAAFKLAEVSFTDQGRPALTGLVIEARPELELTGKTSARLQSGDVTVRTADGRLLMGLKGEVAQAADSGLTGTLNFTLEVPALGSQPAFAGARAVTAGRASGEVRAALGASNQLEGRMTVNGLVAAGTGETLPVANLSFRAVTQADGSIKVQAPLLLDLSGKRSDLNFDLDLVRQGRRFALEGGLRGEHVELADAIAVLGVFMASAAEPASAQATAGKPAAVPAKVVADPVPAWSRFTGRLALEVKSVTRGGDWSMTGLTGLVVIESADVSLQKLAATFDGKGRLAAKALLSFTKGERPYDLTGDFSLTEFDAGRLFKALDPAKPPTVEGVFTVNGKFNGEGETIPRTLERSRGAFELTSRAGVFRGLQRTTNKVSTATKAVELGAAVLGSIFGSEKATKTAEKVAGTAYFVDQLAAALGEFNYDQLNVRLARDDSLNVTLDDISLVSPEIRLVGKGTVTHVEGKGLLEQPLNASLTIAGRGRMEEQLGKVKLLSGAKDELGYAKTRETITLGGTLARPDPTAFFARIAREKLSDLLAPEN